MRIIATSDWHGNLPDLPPADLLLLVGDILPDFEGSKDWRVIKQEKWFKERAVPHCQKIARETVAVWGNHDFYGYYEEQREFGNKGGKVTILQDSGTLVFDEEDHNLVPLYIYGMPWVKNLPSWAFSLDENRMREKCAKIPASTDILISHGPPLYWGDQLGSSGKYGSRWDGEHVGWYELRAWLEMPQITERSPITICGHIHEAFGHYRDRLVNNVSYVDEDYTPKERWLELEYDKEGLRVSGFGYQGGGGEVAAVAEPNTGAGGGADDVDHGVGSEVEAAESRI